jgi:hypothetical protein
VAYGDTHHYKRLTKDLLAERVGFEPANLAAINNLALFSIARIGRNAQNLSIRYKTGTAGYDAFGLTPRGLMEIGVRLQSHPDATTSSATARRMNMWIEDAI